MSDGELAFSGYAQRDEGESDALLTQVGPGTPGGEYLRRFWQPLCVVSELTDVPLRVRALGEELVVFRSKSGQVGALHLHCSHRGTSLEFGRIEECGIRCCYHGRLFGVDGKIIEVPGDPNEESIKKKQSQGAYPTHVFAGLVFAYMGPMEHLPPFPRYDHMELPGIQLTLPLRLPFQCNWVQIKENALDPAHTAVLHAWEERFAAQFGVFPEFDFAEKPEGLFYLAARKIGDNVWVRSTSVLMPHVHIISSIFENGREVKDANPPYLTFFTLPIDDTNSVSFAISHVLNSESLQTRMSFGWVGTGQTDERPYYERQRIPGDHDAQVSQGPVVKHSKEHLGFHDRGVVMFRRRLRKEIEMVQRGETLPQYEDGGIDIYHSFASDRVIPASAVDGDANDPAVLREVARKTGADYLANPPMARFEAKDAGESSTPTVEPVGNRSVDA